MNQNGFDSTSGVSRADHAGNRAEAIFPKSFGGPKVAARRFSKNASARLPPSSAGRVRDKVSGTSGDRTSYRTSTGPDVRWRGSVLYGDAGELLRFGIEARSGSR